MLFSFKKGRVFLSILFLVSIISCMFFLNTQDTYADSQSELKPFIRTRENSPEYFGNPTNVDLSKLVVENGILKGIDNSERIRLWNEAEKHNTPVILDLSSRNDITEVANNAINGTPIMILKLPASITRIGDDAFARNMIRELDFGKDPKYITIGNGAFTQLIANTYDSCARINELETNGVSVYKPVSCDVMFYGISMENPFKISVNGVVKSYASINRIVVIMPFFLSQVVSGDWSHVFVNPEYANFNSPTSSYVSSLYPYRYTASYNGVNLIGQEVLPLDRTFNYDITPISPINNGFPNPKLTLLGYSAGMPMNYMGQPLLSQGWSTVTIKDVYPYAKDDYINNLNNILIKGYNIINLYSSNMGNNISYRKQAAYTSKKVYDFEFMARQKSFKYIYYDVNTGEIIKEKNESGYYGQAMPKLEYPEGYEAFIQPEYFPKDYAINDESPFVYRIPVKKINDDVSNKITITINLINENGVRVGTTYYSIGDKGSEITMPEDLKTFLKKYKYELTNKFEEGMYENNKTITLILKRDVVKKPQVIQGPQGIEGPIGPRGENGKDGVLLDIRISGSNRIKTGIELSGQNFKTSNTVVLASAENFADALTGGIIAGLNKSPILISYKNITQDVLDEIERLKAKNVIIVGGDNSISEKTQKVIQSLGNIKVTRLSGEDRYETSEKVADYIYNKFGNTKEMLIASGEVFPDALTSSQYAIKEKSPILLTDRNKLSNSAKDFIEKNNVKSAIVVGGKNTITENQYNEISIEKKRIAGKDRFATGIEFAKLTYSNPSMVYVASGKKYPDVLCTVPVAYKNQAPILLSDRFYVNNDDIKYYDNNDIKRIWLVGGQDSISNKIYFELINSKNK